MKRGKQVIVEMETGGRPGPEQSEGPVRAPRRPFKLIPRVYGAVLETASDSFQGLFGK